MIVCESGGHANGLTYFIFRFLRRPLLEGLDAQMQAIRDGGSAVVLTSEQAGEILRALRTAEKKQLRG